MPELTREEVERRLESRKEWAYTRQALVDLVVSEREALQTALSLFDRAEQAGERMWEMEKELKRWQSVAREATRAVCHYCEDECVDESLCDECSLSIQPTLDELDRLLDREGHPLTPEALAALKEAPDA